MAKSMQDLTGDGKVLKKIITPGNGPTVADGAMVRVHYNGYLEYSGEPYDSSRLRNKEQQFTLGKGELLWERPWHGLMHGRRNIYNSTVIRLE